MRASLDQHFHTQIRRQESLDSASQVLGESAEALGWDLIGFYLDNDARVSLPRMRNGESIAHAMGWPKAGLEEWLTRQLGLHCPFAERCSKSSDPFAWDCEVEPNRWFGMQLQLAHREVLDHYGRYVAAGITVPVPLSAGRMGVMSWCTRDRGDFERLRTETFGSVFLLSHTFMRHIQALGNDTDMTQRLSPRELECLSWAARGKSEEEISIILGRSYGTIHFHMRNALAKLDAGNRTHAVAIACMRGLINLDTAQPKPRLSS